jgi:hypothetical protein
METPKQSPLIEIASSHPAICCPGCNRIMIEILPSGEFYFQVRGFRVWFEPTKIIRFFCPKCKKMFWYEEALITEVTDREEAHYREMSP